MAPAAFVLVDDGITVTVTVVGFEVVPPELCPVWAAVGLLLVVVVEVNTSPTLVQNVSHSDQAE